MSVARREPEDRADNRDERLWHCSKDRRPVASLEHIARMDRAYNTPRHRSQPRPTRHQEAEHGYGWREFLMAGSLMAVVSAISGAAVYDRTENGVLLKTARAWLDQSGLISPSAEVAATVPAPKAVAQKAAAAPATEKTEAVKVAAPMAATAGKPVATAGIKVQEVISGATNEMIPLPLHANVSPDTQQPGFKLLGLPGEAYLTAGQRIGADGWLLSPAEAQQVKIVVPRAEKPEFTLDVAAVGPANGELLSPFVQMKVDIHQATQAVISPAAAPVNTVTNFNTTGAKPAAALVLLDSDNVAKVAQAVPVSEEGSDEAKVLVAKGDRLMQMGDLVAARSFYERALALGYVPAAVQMGRTYDPSTFVEKKVQGLIPDAALALRYYEQAMTAGIPEGKTLMTQLQTKLQQ